MFHFDRGLKLTDIDLAIDVRRRQARGFISHAHADHTAPHELAFCTPATSQLYQHRHGPRRTVAMPFGATFEWGPLKLTTLPAGHVLGSAMLLAESPEQRLLYTGDFKLDGAVTAERPELPRADVLVMECTFGDPRYRWPPREQVVQQLLDAVEEAWDRGATPVIRAYVLGKAQEVTRLLTEHGIDVRQHPLAYKVSQIYESAGCPLGKYSEYDGQTTDEPTVLIMPPATQRATYMPLPARHFTIAVTGWAIDRNARYRLGVDRAIPLSDHADFDQLLEAVRQVEPQVTYCTHGPASFVRHLQAAGYDARLLDRASQMRLF